MSDDSKKEEKETEKESLGTYRGGSWLGGSSDREIKSSVESWYCPVCERTFPSREAYIAHIPCRG